MKLNENTPSLILNPYEAATYKPDCLSRFIASMMAITLNSTGNCLPAAFYMEYNLQAHIHLSLNKSVKGPE
jgi:hypothetical protein